MKPQPDLIEERLTAWLNALAENGLSSAQRLELEDHVRTRLEAQREQPATLADLASVLADLGDVHVIALEYVKNRPGRARRLLRAVIAHDRRLACELRDAPKRSFGILANAVGWAAAMLVAPWALADTAYADSVVYALTGGWLVSHLFASTDLARSALQREWACVTRVLRSRG